MTLLSLLLFLFIIVSASLFSFYFIIRNDKVAEFRIEIIESIYRKQVEIPFADLKEYTKSIDKNNYDEKELVAKCNELDTSIDVYDFLMDGYEKVSYNSMLYSFKKLTVDNFFSQEWCELYRNIHNYKK